MPRAIRLVLGPLAVAFSPLPVLAQVTWTRVPLLEPAGGAVAGHLGRGRVVLFANGNDDTWEWDGQRWSFQAPVTRPLARSGHALTHDLGAGRTLLFGGRGVDDGLVRSDTWEWDGTNWLQRSPATVPPARWGHALAYDIGRGRVVMFGGVDTNSQSLNDTWEWDGSNWIQRAVATAPAARWGHVLEHDARSGVSLLFGGFLTAQNRDLGDTWTWDGLQWRQLFPATSPSPRRSSALAMDLARGRLVLYGGLAQNLTRLSDTWEWSGSTWLPQNPMSTPGARAGHGLAFDIVRGRVVLVGGATSDCGPWAWDGANWRRVAPDQTPRGRLGHGLAWDAARSRAVLFGGQDGTEFAGGLVTAMADTWEWDGSAWIEQAPASAPSARAFAAFAHDRARGRTVLFGGLDGNRQVRGDTWEWDGTAWAQRSTAVAPAARKLVAATYDPRRGVTVLFGGSDGAGNPLGDTWEWDGTQWQQRQVTPSPSPRFGAVLAFDAARQRIVLFGGCGTQYESDTWEWDGVAWLRRQPRTIPYGRFLHLMAHDAARGRVVMGGGFVGWYHHVLPDAWEWDGSDWTQRSPLAVVRRGSAATTLAWDPSGESLLMFGGIDDDSTYVRASTWRYGPVYPASCAPYGQGCTGSAGVPSLAPAASSLPWLGDGFRLELTALPANAASLALIGTSRTAWGPLPLPLALDPIGMPGCTLLTSGTLVLTMQTTGGAAQLTVPVPGDPALLGGPFFAQAFVADARVNAAGVTAANALAATIGGR